MYSIHRNAPPTGQKNRQKKLEKKRAPISDAGRIYHCIPTPSKEKSIAKGSYDAMVGLDERNISIRDNQSK